MPLPAVLISAASTAASVTASAKSSSTCPVASCARRTTIPLKSAFIVTVPGGWVVNTSCVATTSDVRLLLATAGRSPSAPSAASSACSPNVSPSIVARYVTVNPVNVATPATAATLLLAYVALPDPVSVSVTVSVKSASTNPLASRASTTGSVVKSSP